MKPSPKRARIRLSRAAGFDLQACSKIINGLPAVNCSRPSKWGNPFTKANSGSVHPALRFACEVAPLWDVSELRGKNLACWCVIGDPCHADVLLEFANEAA